MKTKKISKLKMNKQTIALLNSNGAKQLDGGSDSPTRPTEGGTCGYTCGKCPSRACGFNETTTIPKSYFIDLPFELTQTIFNQDFRFTWRR